MKKINTPLLVETSHRNLWHGVLLCNTEHNARASLFLFDFVIVFRLQASNENCRNTLPYPFANYGISQTHPLQEPHFTSLPPCRDPWAEIIGML